MDVPLHVITGIVYLTLIAICLPLHLFILWIFVSVKEFRTNVAYVIMLNLGIFECLELVLTIFDGIATLFRIQGGDLTETIIGGLNSAAWDTHGPVILVLSLNRLNAFFSAKRTRLFTTLLVLAWLYFAIKFGINIAVDCCYFEPAAFIWNYKQSEFMTVLQFVSYGVIIVSLSLSLLAYFAIFAIMVSTRRAVSSLEIRLLAQTTLIFLATVATVTIYNYGINYLPESPFTVMGIGIMNILIGGLNPLLYLTLNPTIRQCFLQKLGINKTFSATTIAVSQRSGKLM